MTIEWRFDGLIVRVEMDGDGGGDPLAMGIEYFFLSATILRV